MKAMARLFPKRQSEMVCCIFTLIYNTVVLHLNKRNTNKNTLDARVNIEQQLVSFIAPFT